MNVTPVELQRRESKDEAESSDVDGYDPEMPIAKSPEAEGASEPNDSEAGNTDSKTPVSNEEAPKDESDDEYDPESMDPSPEPDNGDVGSTASVNEDDDYDPENGLASPEVKDAEKPVPSLPSKPTVAPASSSDEPPTSLKEAYDAIMQSDLVKRPEFKQLSQEQQMALIEQQLREKGIHLPQLDTSSDMNYDQVYSFNKPFDSRNPIPLVPKNKFCRRPNITVPMSTEESDEFTKYLAEEAKYQDRRSLDDFPEKSRLFIGNLSTNTISKEDLFRICNKYGEVVSITLKGGYGFAQFKTAEQCADCIKGETDVPLHGRFMRLDASTNSKKSSQENVQFRERSAEKSSDTVTSENSGPNCQIFVTVDSSPDLVEATTKVFEDAGFVLKIDDIGEQDLSEVIPDAAYSGVLAACIIKAENVDLQTFEETEDGGIKFDEYVDLTPSVAVDVVKEMEPSDNSRPTSAKRSRDESSYDSDRHSHNNRNSRHDTQSRKQRKKDRPKDRQGTNQPNIPHVPAYQNPSQFTPNNSSPYGLPAPPFQHFPQHAYPGYSQNQFPGTPSNNSFHNSNQPNLSDPNVLQILQNVDPNTLQQVIALLQSQQQAPANQHSNMMYQQQVQGGYPGAYGQPTHPPPPPMVQQPSQLNNLLSQLQSPQQPYSNQGYRQQQHQQQHQQPNYQPNYPQQTQQQQQQPPQQPGQSSTLMDMLARLSKQ
ncbi:uncharacterized protein CXQ87_000091 [Candidozyma duobushaemuli]|uniref:RRM domain-containing protein n=2 Tax=Candidozyma TaxID=3303203 RepID=A0ABX8I0F5_9ASCO|nr:uncharacterized protein CXQ87_000091 [[Candida] duobushaemulonis]PVH17209.1 hypothetical protein CXQ87_000091 [[Candida] duobushaemulonis]QWU85868.1 hypothetical protein CA3LBN_000086 [[Candida] haemuloni]